ncbi:MAG: ABC transporter ATP-binding protein [Rhodoplanes sp.]
MSIPLIETKDLCKTYSLGSNEVRALVRVSATIKRGEFVAIMGASGSGKSTLMHQIGCLDTPTSGVYRLDGLNVSSLDHNQLADIRNRMIGFCFQSYNLLPLATAFVNVQLPLVYAGVPRRQREERASAVLADVGLADRMHHLPSQLSGGQQQRVAIARALVNEPLLILADEPTGTLDSRTGREIMELFCQLNGSGKTIVIVTHDTNVARYAKRNITLRDGSVACDDGEMTDLLLTPRGEECENLSR